MSRINTLRWARILAWTGAGVAWGAALVGKGLEPSRVESTTPEPVPSVSDVRPLAVMPEQPEAGLVILRYEPAPDAVTTRRVYIEGPPPAQQTARAATAPAPRSQGS